MPRMKYIRYDAGIADAFIVFSEFVDHGTMANQVCPNKDLIVSAGFVKFDYDGDIRCFGRSHTLDMSSDEEDTDLLAKQLNLYEE